MARGCGASPEKVATMRRRVVAVAVGFGLCAYTPAFGQQRTERSPIRILAETLGESLPAEFAADLLIQIADSPAAAKEGAAWRQSIYEHAFELAVHAQEPLKLTAGPGVPVDSEIGLALKGYAFKLDSLSLRVRSVSGLLPLQAQRALELANTLDVSIPPASCRDLLVPDTSAAYDLAASISRKLASPVPGSDNRNILLERLVASVRSSTQIAPALNAHHVRDAARHPIAEPVHRDDEHARVVIR